MPIVPPKLKKDIEDAVSSALAREFAEEASISDTASADHKRLAAAISDMGLVIATFLISEVAVAPGIPLASAGSPVAHTGSTVGPGKLV